MLIFAFTQQNQLLNSFSFANEYLAHPMIIPIPNRYWLFTWFAYPLRASVNGKGTSFFSKTAPIHQLLSIWPEERKEKKIQFQLFTTNLWDLLHQGLLKIFRQLEFPLWPFPESTEVQFSVHSATSCGQFIKFFFILDQAHL